MGGLCEKLIGITKRAIAETLGLCKPSGDQWSAVLAEIEATVNSRPLTYVGDDDITILTRNHFLGHNLIFAIPISDDGDDSDYEPPNGNKDQIAAAWEERQQPVANILDNVQQRVFAQSKKAQATEIERNSTTGEITQTGEVAIFEPKKQRTTWLLGKVEKLIPTEDGEARSAELRYPSRRTAIARCLRA